MVIDALRALAALMVLVSHGRHEPPTGFPQMTSLDAFGRTGLGQGGVVLFFSVSGFLIAGPFLRALLGGAALPATRAYVVRRAARILPAYWVALTATVLLDLSLLGVPSLRALFSHLFLVHSLVPGELLSIMFVFWTLSIEALFYVAVPLATRAVRQARSGPIPADTLAVSVGGLWVLSVICGLLAAGAYPDSPQAPLWSLARFNLLTVGGLFCPGMLLVVASSPEAAGSRIGGLLDQARRNRAAVACAGACAWVLAWLCDTSTSSVVTDVRYPLLSVAAGIALFCATEWSTAGAHAVVRRLATLGVISYGLYLWHVPAIVAMTRIGGILGSGSTLIGWLTNALITLIVTTVVATASWHGLEHPLIAAAQRVRGARPRSQPALARPRPVSRPAHLRPALAISAGLAILGGVTAASAAIGSSHRFAGSGATAGTITLSQAQPGVVPVTHGSVTPDQSHAGAAGPAAAAGTDGLPASHATQGASAGGQASTPGTCRPQDLVARLTRSGATRIPAGTAVSFVLSIADVSDDACSLDSPAPLLSVAAPAGAGLAPTCALVVACPVGGTPTVRPDRPVTVDVRWSGMVTGRCASPTCPPATAAAGRYTVTVTWGAAVATIEVEVTPAAP